MLEVPGHLGGIYSLSHLNFSRNCFLNVLTKGNWKGYVPVGEISSGSYHGPEININHVGSLGTNPK